MVTIRRFEDIEGWQLARELARSVYSASARGPFGRDFALRDQVRRAAASTMSNIAEGFERDGNKEFVRVLAVAKGSAGEVLSQLYIAFDQGYLSAVEFESLAALCRRTGAALGSLMRYLSSSPLAGAKFRRSNEKPGTRIQKPFP